jgi:ATP phosphoribosyltransferase regulatory subunit
MIAMAIEVLQRLGIDNFKIDIGQVEFFRGIMAGSGLASGEKARIEEAIRKKDVSAVGAILDQSAVPDSVREELAALPRLFGGREVIHEASRVARNDRSRRALDNMAEVLNILDIYGLSEYLTIDLGEIRGLDYHTGVTFEGFVGGVGEAVCGGGRYDTLTARYGYPAPATGFAFNILPLLAALEKQPDVEASKTRDFLLFNMKEDRRQVLEIAQALRRKGFSTARDIIRRNFDESLSYAQTTNILHMMVIGGGYCADDEVYIVRVADKISMVVKMADLLADSFCLRSILFKEKCNG